MAVVTYTKLTSRGGGVALPGGAQDPLDEAQYPLVLSTEEEAALDFQHIQNVIRGRVQAPSNAARLDQGNLPVSIQTVDDVFRRALRRYRDELTVAIGDDVRGVAVLDATLATSLDTTNYTRKYRNIGFFFLLLGAIPGHFIGKSRDKQRIAANDVLDITTRHEQSAHRRRWLAQVDTLEIERIQQTDLILNASIRPLVTELEEIIGSGETDDEKVEELRQVWTVYVALFPDKDDLEIGGTEVSEFLQQL